MSQTSTRVSREKTTDGPTTTTKVTTYKTSYETQNDGPTAYRSQIYPRTTLIQRGGGLSQQKQTGRMSVSQAFNSMPVAQPGAYSNVTTAGVTSIRNGRDREKKDMQDLNERFATYIEKVRFLEAQNRKLADELAKLKERWGNETKAIKAMYEVELEEARKVINEAEKEKARLEIRCSSLEEQIEELRGQ